MKKTLLFTCLTLLFSSVLFAAQSDSETAHSAALMPESVEIRGKVIFGVEFQSKGTLTTIDGYPYFVEDLLSDTILLDMTRFVSKDESETLPAFFTTQGSKDPRPTERKAQIYINAQNEIVYDLAAYRLSIKDDLRKLYPKMSERALDQLSRDQFNTECEIGFMDYATIYAKARTGSYKSIDVIIGVGFPYAKGMSLDISGSDRYSSKPSASFSYYKTFYTKSTDQKETKSALKVTYEKDIQRASAISNANIKLFNASRVSKNRTKSEAEHVLKMTDALVETLPLELRVNNNFKGVYILRQPQIASVNVVNNIKFDKYYWCIQGRYFGSTPKATLEFKNEKGKYVTRALKVFKGSNTKETYLYHEDTKKNLVRFPVRVPSSKMIKSSDYAKNSVVFVEIPELKKLKKADPSLDADLLINSGYAYGGLGNIYALADEHRELCSKAEDVQMKKIADGTFSYTYAMDHFYAAPLYRGQLIFQLVDSYNKPMISGFYTDYETVSLANFGYQNMAYYLQMVPLLSQKMAMRTRLRIYEVSEDRVVAKATATKNRSMVNPVAEQTGENDIYLGEGGGSHLYIPDSKSIRYVGEFSLLP